MVDYRDDHTNRRDDLYDYNSSSGGSLAGPILGLIAVAVIVGAIFMVSGGGGGEAVNGTEAPATLEGVPATPAEPAPAAPLPPTTVQ